MVQTEREALWINLRSDQPFALKIYMGGVNAVSGQPATETEETMLRRKSLLHEDQSIQDYLVIPDQKWLDGVANADGTVRQFVAVRAISGYSVEAQITGHNHVGGLQFEVTPAKPLVDFAHVLVKLITGKSFTILIKLDRSVSYAKRVIEQQEGIPVCDQRFLYEGKQLEGE